MKMNSGCILIKACNGTIDFPCNHSKFVMRWFRTHIRNTVLVTRSSPLGAVGRWGSMLFQWSGLSCCNRPICLKCVQKASTDDNRQCLGGTTPQSAGTKDHPIRPNLIWAATERISKPAAGIGVWKQYSRKITVYKFFSSNQVLSCIKSIKNKQFMPIE